MLEKFNLVPFGAFHTALALVALVAAAIALLRHGEIGTRSRAGLVYILFTIATCITGLFLFRHGGFGPPHALAVMTLLVLGIAFYAERRGGTGLARHAAVLGYSLTLFFHLIPGLTETGTRLPLGAPLFTGPEDPSLKAAVGVGFLVYLVGAAVQVARLRRARP